MITLSSGLFAQHFAEWDEWCEKTDLTHVSYKEEEIVVRGFDGVNTPPRLDQKERQLFYSYGITAYWWYYDQLEFFHLLYLEAVHRDSTGAEIKRFPMNGHFSEEFKHYFKSEIPAERKKNIFFERIYLKDTDENYLRLEKPQTFCPHCSWEEEESEE